MSCAVLCSGYFVFVLYIQRYMSFSLFSQSSPSIFRHPFCFINMPSGPWSITRTVWVYREYLFYGLGLAYLSAAIFTRKATAVNNPQALEVSWPSPPSSSSTSHQDLHFLLFFYLHAKRLLLFRKHDAYLKTNHHPTPLLKKKKVCVWGVWVGVHGASEPQNQLH